MNRQEHLLVIFAEECSEIAKEVSKALRFGLYDFDPNDPELTNLGRIQKEFNQLMAVRDMLLNEGIYICDDKTVKHDKRANVEKYLNYSKECGTLTD